MTQAQQRTYICKYIKNMGSHTLKRLKKLSFDKIKELFETTMKRIKDFVPMESDKLVPKISTGSSKRTAEIELEHEGSKRKKTNEEQSAEEEKELSEEELQKLIMIVLMEEVYVEALQVKYPIIDWEVYSEDTRKYWKIIRVGNHTEAYQTFDDMLKKFDRDDLDKLWSLLKERFSSTDPTDDKERTLWVELKRLFEPDIDDILWKLQRYMHDPLTWRLYDICGVHHVSTDKGHDIFMLVEKDYPLTRGLLTLMLFYVDDIIFGSTKKELCIAFKKLMHEKFQISFMGELTFFLELQVKQKKDGIFISQDKYVDEILKKFRFTEIKTSSTPMETQKPLLKDENGKEVDVYMYRSIIDSLMYLTSLRPNIMFVVCACARYQANPKASHLSAMKRIFRYLKGQLKLGLWYPKDSPFDLVAYTDSDYAGASLDRKSTTGGCQFLRCRLIS
ncbi:uncharacterized mitochondrial protein-like protein [Tanacetum coccineum]